MKKLAVVMVAVFAMVSCSKKPEAVSEEFNELMKEVIEVHDIAMAEMGTIMSLKQELLVNMDTSSVADSVLLKAIKDLDAAHEGMMVWMRDFSNAFSAEQLTNGLPDTYATEEEKAEAVKALQELKAQKMAVKVMNEDVQESLIQAKSILGKE